MFVIFLCIAIAAARTTVVTTNAPVLRWSSKVNPSGVFAYRIVVAANTTYDSGWVYGINEPFPGLFVYDGPPLHPSTIYTWTASEKPLGGNSYVAGNGSFTTAPNLPTARDEAISQLTSNHNFTALFNNALASVYGRVQPSGYVPTSVSDGYGGPTNMFVRDTCSMLLGIMELGGANATSTTRLVLGFVLAAIERFGVSYAPHVMTSDPTLSTIVSLDMADQTDGTMHLVQTFARYLTVSNDNAFATRWYPLLKRLLNHYTTPGAVANGGVPYFNASLSLLFNPNLEHSRLGHYWTTFDVLTNTFAVEAMRQLADVAVTQGDDAQAAAWRGLRAKVLVGLTTSLTFSSDEYTHGAPIYAELIGHVHYWWPGSNNSYPDNGTGPLFPLWGMSFVNTAVAAALSGVLGMPHVSAAAAGLDIAQLDATRDTYRRVGSFLWLNNNHIDASALVSTTHVNSSTHTDPQRAVIGKGLGWDIAQAAYRRDYVRVLTLVRWLGAAAGNLTLYGEQYDYDCVRLGQSNCYGDLGNGEQTGWFLWGVGVARNVLGI